jgi:putative heme degradation protein
MYMNPFSAWSAVGAVPSERGWSEQTLLSLLWGDHVKPLQTRWASLFRDLTSLGAQHVVATNQVGALGVYAPLSWIHGDGRGGRLGTTGVDIDLDFERIGAAFATGAPRCGVLPRSVRLFDRYGDALLTLAKGPGVSCESFQAFVKNHGRPAPSPLPTVKPLHASARPGQPENVDTAIQAWAELQDRRGLESVLKDHKVSRQMLYNAASEDVAQSISAREVVELLRFMVSQKAPMALQVGREGMVAVARVVAEEVAVTTHGVELAGSTAVLRLDPRRMHHAWLVTHRTPHGKKQRSIELLDDAGELAVCLGGAEQGMAAGVSGWTRAPFRPGV